MSQTLEELEQIIKEAHDQIEELEATERMAALEQEAFEIEEDMRLEAEAQELYDEIEEEKARAEVERGQYTGERIAASVKEMVKSIPEPKQTGKAEFSFTIDKRALFNVVTQIGKLCDEATFEVNQDGLTFRGMDPSHVALIDFSLPNSCFYSFEVEPDDNRKFAVRLDEFLLLFKKFDKNEREVTLSMGYDSMLTVKSGMFNAKVHTIESSATMVPLPKLNFNAKLDISIEALRQISGFIDGLTYLIIESDSRKLQLSSKGDTGEYAISFDNSIDNYKIQMQIKEVSKATYSINYLKPFITPFLRDFKAVQAETLTFEYSTKMPAKLSYSILGGGRIDFYLAPRVQD